MLYPTEIVMQQIRRDMEREVANLNLTRLAREGQPTLLQRITARLNVAQSVPAVSEQQPLPRKGVVALSR